MTSAYAHLLAWMTVVGVRLEDHVENRKERGATAVEYGLLVGLIAAGKDWDFLNINGADNVLHLLSALAGLAIALMARRRTGTARSTR